MHEFRVPSEDHIAITRDPARLFPLALGLLGELAAKINSSELSGEEDAETRKIALFSAHFIDAYRGGKFREDHDAYYSILSSAAYYLSDIPGSSRVLIDSLDKAYPELDCAGLDALLIWLLGQGRDALDRSAVRGPFEREIVAVANSVKSYVSARTNMRGLAIRIALLREAAYGSGTPRQLLVADLACAVARLKVLHSSRRCLPAMSGISVEAWSETLARPRFVQELWPAQRLLGQRGVFSGQSAVIQMPTSAGKTRSVEIVIRSGFLSGRTRVAVIVAPFKALCQEIGTHLKDAFRGEAVDINEPSDVLQSDFDVELTPGRFSVLVATPEKLLFITRHEPELASQVGLVIYDEGHQFDSGIRGVTYELLLSSLKEAMPSTAQVLLISAVIGNGEAVSEWLLGDRGRVINGATLSPTLRSVAFSSFERGAGLLRFVSEDAPNQEEFWVPRLLLPEPLEKIGKRGAETFPNRTEGKDVALSLGSKLAENGGVAIFCGRKDSVPKLCERALEVLGRGIGTMDLSRFSSVEEVGKLANLYAAHYGEDSLFCRAASIGIFTHHRNVPQGLRVAVEHAMRERDIAFVICTSTLAQGVNLPLRYLLVTSVYQGRERIRKRDFQNLMGRVGRSGMFTEGSVIFTDPDLYDLRASRRDRWRFDGVSELLRANVADPCESSLLRVLKPILNGRKTVKITAEAGDLARIYIEDPAQIAEVAVAIVRDHGPKGFDLSETRRQLDEKVSTFGAIESFLLAHWDESDGGLSDADIADLAKGTFAYSVAGDSEKEELLSLFAMLGGNVADKVKEPERRRVFGRSLYGVEDSLTVERWALENMDAMTASGDSTELLSVVWPIMREQIGNGNVRKAEPNEILLSVAAGWIDGQPYHELLTTAAAGGLLFRTPKQARTVTLDHIVDICESGLAYDGAHCVSAIIGAVRMIDSGKATLLSRLALLQKRLRYGLQTRRMIKIYEAGFTDRVIAKEISRALRPTPTVSEIVPVIITNEAVLRPILLQYPKYFETVLDAMMP